MANWHNPRLVQVDRNSPFCSHTSFFNMHRTLRSLGRTLLRSATVTLGKAERSRRR